MITHRFAFDQVLQSFETADTQPDAVCKAIVKMQDSAGMPTSDRC